MSVTTRARRAVPRLGWAAALVLALVGAAATARVLKAPLGWGTSRPRMLLPDRGCRVKSFALRDTRGRLHSADEWRGCKGVVLVFLETDCPVVDGYAPLLRRLSAAYGPRGIGFYGVHARGDVSAEAAARHAAEHGLGFPILLDPAQVVAAEAGVRRTPEAVLLAPDGQVLYGGRIDDRFAPAEERRDRDASRPGDLEAALAAVADDEMPIVGETRAYGCPLPPPERPRRVGEG